MRWIAATALAVLVLTASAGRAAAVGPEAGARSPNYAKAAAHDPMFEDKTLWPMLTGKEYYPKQAWPKARLMVWAKPGTNGGKRARGIDLLDPKNWIEDGRPCTKVVFDENTDIVLPPADKPYSINGREDGAAWPDVFRHITVCRNALLGGGGDGKGRKIHGNVWIKQGAGMDAQGATQFLGPGHVFFRNDNTPETARGEGRGEGIMSSQYFVFNKEAGGSVEFLGHVTVLDEFRLFGCTVIVGPDSFLQPGRNASPTIQNGGVLALMDGARFESWNNDFGTPEMTVTDGAIQGGLPDRPLTRSCTYGLAFKNYTAARYTGPGAQDSSGGKPRYEYRRVPSLIVEKGALRSYSQDLAKAHLIFTVMENQAFWFEPGDDRYESTVKRNPEYAQVVPWLKALPHGTDVYLSKEAVVDGVEFDYLRKGGLMVQDPAARARWKNVFFGPHCQATGAEVFGPLAKLERGGGY